MRLDRLLIIIIALGDNCTVNSEQFYPEESMRRLACLILVGYLERIFNYKSVEYATIESNLDG